MLTHDTHRQPGLKISSKLIRIFYTLNLGKEIEHEKGKVFFNLFTEDIFKLFWCSRRIHTFLSGNFQFINTFSRNFVLG